MRTGCLCKILFVLVAFIASITAQQNCTSTIPAVSIERQTSSFQFMAQLQEPTTSIVRVQFEHSTSLPAGCQFTALVVNQESCLQQFQLLLAPSQFEECGIQRNETESAILFGGSVLVSATNEQDFERVFRYPFQITFAKQVQLVQSFSLQSGAQFGASLRLQKQYFDVSKRAGVIQGEVSFSDEFQLVIANATSSTDAQLQLSSQITSCSNVTSLCVLQFTLEAFLLANRCTFTGQYEIFLLGSNIDLGEQEARLLFQIGSEDVCGVIKINVDPIPSLQLLNQNQVATDSFVDNEPITFQVQVASDFPLQSTMIKSLFLCAIPTALSNASSTSITCNDVNAVAVSSAIQDYVAFGGVTVLNPNVNTATASLTISRAALSTVRPLVNYQFIVQTTISVTYANQLETRELKRVQQQAGRSFDSKVGKRFKLFDIRSENSAFSVYHNCVMILVIALLLLAL